MNKSGKINMDRPISFLEHLADLRKRILLSVLAVLICSVGTYRYVPGILEHLARPVGKFIFLGPAEAFGVRIKLSIFLGMFISLPFVLYQLWCFVEKGLKGSEKRYVFPLTLASFLLFSLGAGFCYLVILPIGMKFLLSYSTSVLVPTLSISRYISFLLALLFSFGLIFQLPLVSAFLTRTGVISTQTLIKNRRVAIVLIFVVAAILTPPDVFTQLLMGGPLIILYELSILISKLVRRKE